MFHKCLDWIDLLALGCGDRIWAYHLVCTVFFPPLNRYCAWYSSILSPVVLYGCYLLDLWRHFEDVTIDQHSPGCRIHLFARIPGKEMVSPVGANLRNLPISSESIWPYSSCGQFPLLFCLSEDNALEDFLLLLGSQDNTTLMAESEEELKILLMKVKKEKKKGSEKGEWKSWLKAQHSEN